MHTHNIIIIYGAHTGMENQYRNTWKRYFTESELYDINYREKQA